jgi:cell wall-associated NlpC family hydrolase
MTLWIEEARQYIGAPFHWHGRSEHGIDCLGLVLVALQGAGVVPQDFEFFDYGNRPRKLIEELRTTGFTWLEEIPIEQATHGDLLCYPIGKTLSHLAWIDGDDVIHSSFKSGVVCDRRADWAVKEAKAVAFRVKV